MKVAENGTDAMDLPISDAKAAAKKEKVMISFLLIIERKKILMNNTAIKDSAE